jgi:ATP-dependent DNA helicase DinG
MLADRLFGRKTVVLTSATLALGGSFEPLARQWGLPPSGEHSGGATPAKPAGGRPDGRVRPALSTRHPQIPNGRAVESAAVAGLMPPRPAGAVMAPASPRRGDGSEPAADSAATDSSATASAATASAATASESRRGRGAGGVQAPPREDARAGLDAAAAVDASPAEPADAGAASGAAALTWSGIDVGSPFDHPRSGILYVARHLPPPGRDGLPEAYLAELAELIAAAGGRTLGLFSSMRAARQAAEELREKVGYPLLCQGDDSTALLVTQFAADEPTCLFGTLSLWQGVDVPGPSLQLVVIDRIPFPRPDDPLASARQRAVSARGGNGFMAVAATGAALLLAQGTGRLLRTMTDRGVVAILDPRLVTARYGGFLRESLPPFWTTTDPEVVRAALRRLAAARVS